MHEYSLSELMAQRDALDKRIADHQPLSLPVGIKKVRDYAIEHGMTEDELFPSHQCLRGRSSDFTMNDSCYDPDCDIFPKFQYPDTFDYTFIIDLQIQRSELNTKIRAIRCEAIGRARAFIHEYNFTKVDICTIVDQAN